MGELMGWVGFHLRIFKWNLTGLQRLRNPISQQLEGRNVKQLKVFDMWVSPFRIRLDSLKEVNVI